MIKRKPKFEYYKNLLQATQLENKKNRIEKIKTDADSLKESHEKFIKNNKLMLKTQQRFKSQNHNVFAEDISIIALSLNDDKRIQSIVSIETHAYGTSKDLVCQKEEMKCSNIMKQCKMINVDYITN